MSGKVVLNNKDSGAKFRTSLNAMFTELFETKGTAFCITGKISAISAATPVVLIPDGDVGSARKVIVSGVLVCVDGSTSWSGAVATKLSIVSSTTELASVLKANLLANAKKDLSSTEVVIGSAIVQGFGGPLGKGISIVGDANFDAGSDIYVTISGVIRS
jgi:hypothetical protein